MRVNEKSLIEIFLRKLIKVDKMQNFFNQKTSIKTVQ